VFSGLVASSGTVVEVSPLLDGGLTLRVRCADALSEGVQPKDSIAVNGVCLTATRVHREVVSFDVVPETLQRSTIGSLRAGDIANVEYSLRLGDRMGGHFVYGHVDAPAGVLSLTAEGQGVRMRLERPPDLARYILEKAFVSVDGVSVTVAAVADDWFELALIPETLARTTLGRRGVGDRVNLEVDPIARYAAGAARSHAV
jgi:riboflavin synthase